jgi:hypothetical protein
MRAGGDLTKAAGCDGHVEGLSETRISAASAASACRRREGPPWASTSLLGMYPQAGKTVEHTTEAP